MLKRRLKNIPACLHHWVANAASQSIGSKVQGVKYAGRRGRNNNNVQTAISFRCGGLDVAPSCHYKPGKPNNQPPEEPLVGTAGEALLRPGYALPSPALQPLLSAPLCVR